MKIVFFILVFFISTVAVWADEPKHNMLDRDYRTDIYQLSQAGQVVGEVRVEAEFVLEPLIAPVKITVKIKCINNPESEDLIVDSISAYDYGTADLLSTFNVDERRLTVYYRLGMVDEDRRVGFAEDGDQDKIYDLSSYCKVDL